MNILVLNGSPRKKGNTEIMADAFIKGASEQGHQVEKVNLGHMKIAPCLACEFCFTHNGVCVQKDDMAEILDKMVEADVIVLATPVYFYTMDAQMKTLIDRTVPRYTEIQNKDFYFIVAAADTERKMMERTIEGFRGFTQDCLTGAREKGIIYGTGAWQAGEIKGTPAVKQAYEMGRNV